jgi:hypothetical protein
LALSANLKKAMHIVRLQNNTGFLAQKYGYLQSKNLFVELHDDIVLSPPMQLAFFYAQILRHLKPLFTLVYSTLLKPRLTFWASATKVSNNIIHIVPSGRILSL